MLKGCLNSKVVIKCNSLAASIFLGFFSFPPHQKRLFPPSAFGTGALLLCKGAAGKHWFSMFRWAHPCTGAVCQNSLLKARLCMQTRHGELQEWSMRDNYTSSFGVCIPAMNTSSSRAQVRAGGSNRHREEALPCPRQLRSWAKLFPCKSNQNRTNVLHLTHKQENQEFIFPQYLASSVLIDFDGGYRLGFNLH